MRRTKISICISIQRVRGINTGRRSEINRQRGERQNQRKTDPGSETQGHRNLDCFWSLLLAMEAEGRSEQGKQKKGRLCSSLWPEGYPATGTLTSTVGE